MDRYLDAFTRIEPSVAAVGDAYTEEQAKDMDEAVGQLRDDYPHNTFVVVPKCEEAFEILDNDIVLGYANGYSDIQAEDLGLEKYRGREVHILGSSPTQQYKAIQQLTQPNLRDDPPANIKGVDWNGAHKGAYFGEYWSRNGWQPADHLSIRETVEESLKEVKAYWQDKGLWPETEPKDIYGGPYTEPDDPVFAASGRDIDSKEKLETSHIGEYDGNTYAFESATAKRFVEHREGLF
nr:DUF6610 family protein [Halococcus sediminicola]